MNFVSTRDASVRAGLGRAIVDGIAPDGGLYVPERLPAVAPGAFPDTDALDRLAPPLIAPFAEGDALAPELEAVCRDRSCSRPRSCRSRARPARRACSSCFTARRSPSRTSARA